MSDNLDNELINKVSELQQEAKEHQLVLDAFKAVESTRKCFRMIGGILVERTVADIKPSLEENLSNIEKAIDNLGNTILKRRQERASQGGTSTSPAVLDPAVSSSSPIGVLA